MVNYRLQSPVFCILLATMTFISCSNGHQETSAESDHTDHPETMTEQEHSNLFIIESGSENSHWETLEESQGKQKMAVINPSFIAIDSTGIGQEFVFNLYDGETLTGEISRVSTDISGLKSISGPVLEDKGSFVFTVNEGRLLGQLRLSGLNKIVQIGYSEEYDIYILRELDRDDMDVLPGSAPIRRDNQ